MNPTRRIWLAHMLRIASPVFEALSRNQLRNSMPIEHYPGSNDRSTFSHLEALGRSLAGIGPWLDITHGISPEEEAHRDALLHLVRMSIRHATHPDYPDFMNFTVGAQPLVDAAFLALGLLRSWNNVWLQLDDAVQESVINCMKSTRRIRPFFNNWLLFSAMIEAFLQKAGCDWDRMRVDYAIRQHEQWYKGDGAYGDGPRFHWDYYNSFVIHPLLYELTRAIPEFEHGWPGYSEQITARARRYALIQERIISPDGTFPVFGRSLVYRFGIFHHLATMVLYHEIPSGISLAGIRCAMTAAMNRLLDADGTFDRNGWLTIGFCGHQPSIGEPYISTGSLYLTLCGFLPLGLAEDDRFWSEPDADWTAKRIWSGEDMPCDQALPD